MTNDALDDLRWEMKIVAGPDAGRIVPLGVGRTVIGGRACRGAIALDDPDLAAFHLLVEVTSAGVEVHPLADVHLRRQSLAAGEVIRFGRTMALLAPRSRRTTSPGCTGGTFVHHRPPRVRPTPLPAPPADVQEPPPQSLPVVTSPVPALLGAAVTGVIAIAIGQPLLALLGLSGTAVALVTWGHASLGRRRRRRAQLRTEAERIRRRSTELTNQRHDATVRRRLDTADLCEAVARVACVDTRLWERRPDHDDVWSVVLGLGDDVGTVWDGPLRDVPITVDLGPGAVVAVGGDTTAARALVCSLIVQLAAHVGPADVTFAVIADDIGSSEAWHWLEGLPHTASVTISDGVGSLAASDRHRIVIVDSASTRVVSPSADAIVVVARNDAMAPATSTAHGTIDERGALRWHLDPAAGLPVPVAAALCGLDRARAAATALGSLVDPECGDAVLDEPVALSDLVCSDAASVQRTWHNAGIDPPPRVVLGCDVHGRPVEIDLARDGPHAVIGGTTGSGKSELLRTLVVGLAATSPPSAMSFLLVDYKGGAAFDACIDLPHVVGVLTDLDGRSTERALRSLEIELHRRERLLRDAGTPDLDGYRRVRGGAGDIARLVIVVDEFAAMAVEMPDAMRALVSVAQRGRSLGVHLVLATQRPAGVVTDDIRANTSIRIALRVAGSADALDLVGDPAPASFPRDRPGRALLRLGADEPIPLQVAHVGANGSGDDPLRALVDVIGSAARAAGDGPPHRPWTPPLPARVGPEVLVHPLDHGVVDDPDVQGRRALRWEPWGGHLVVVGAVGTGCSSTARTVLRQLFASCDDIEAHVVDALGDIAWDALAPIAAVGTIVRLDDTERLARLFGHLAGLVEERRSRGDERFPVVTVIDGLGGVRRALDDLGPEVVADWERVVADGPAVGVVLVVTTDHAATVPLALLGRAGQRWLLPVADPMDASLLGAPVKAVPPTGSPPGRVLCLPAALEAQVLAPGGHAPVRSSVRRAPVIEVLPRQLPIGDLPASRVEGDGWSFVVGLAARDRQPVWCRLERGDHLTVLGPARSGRSTYLAALSSVWANATDAPVLVLALRRGEPWHAAERALGSRAVWCPDTATLVENVDAAGGPSGRALVVIDDADRVDDTDGRLEQLVGARRISIVAALRADRGRSGLGHWTTALRRTRTGVVFAASDAGDAFGVVLPRRPWIPPSPGRGWWVDDGAVIDVVQTPIVDDGLALHDEPVGPSRSGAQSSY